MVEEHRQYWKKRRLPCHACGREAVRTVCFKCEMRVCPDCASDTRLGYCITCARIEASEAAHDIEMCGYSVGFPHEVTTEMAAAKVQYARLEQEAKRVTHGANYHERQKVVKREWAARHHEERRASSHAYHLLVTKPRRELEVARKLDWSLNYKP